MATHRKAKTVITGSHDGGGHKRWVGVVRSTAFDPESRARCVPGTRPCPRHHPDEYAKHAEHRTPRTLSIRTAQ